MSGKWSPNKLRVQFLLIALSVGCGALDTSADGGRSDSGPSIDGGLVDGGRLDSGPSVDGGLVDGGEATDGGQATDAGGSLTPPAVVAVAPLNRATAVPLNGVISATFSEAMDSSTLTASTFTVTSGTPPVSIDGRIMYSASKAVFWPSALLAQNTSITATITTGAKSASGIALLANDAWSFTTGTTVVAGIPVDLGTAGDYVVLAKTAVSTVSPSAVTGDLGVSPAAATYITGFSLKMDPTNVFSTSAQVTGNIYAADYSPPTPINLTTAIGDMETAFTAAAGRAPDVTELGAGGIGGMTLPAGVYAWGSGVVMPTNVTLTGSATDVWVFQIAQNLTVSSGAELILSGGALAKNVFWQVSGNLTLGTTARFEGVVLCQTAITLNTGASVTGRLLAQSAVTLNSSTVVAPE